MKALGLGWRGLAFRDIEVDARRRAASPCSPFTARRSSARGPSRSGRRRSSITHGRDIAAAVVALLTRARPTP